jgi:hypothetical protein
MAKKNIITNPDVAEETVEVATPKTTAVKTVKKTAVKTEAPSPEVPAKPKLSPAQIKELCKDISRVTLKARGII